MPNPSFEQDKKYIATLAQAIGLKSEDFYKLDSIMGAEELAVWLQKTTYKNFLSQDDNIKEKFNLHIHSEASDGIFTPQSFLDTALDYALKHNLNYMVVAITDHDSVDSAKEVVKLLANNHLKYQKLKVVLGCEFSSAYIDNHLELPIDFELLYYCLNPFDKSINQLLDNTHQKRKRAIFELIAYFNKNYGGHNFLATELMSNRANLQKGLGCNLPYEFYGYITNKIADSSLKTTIYKTIFGLDKLAQGKVFDFNQDVADVLKLFQKNKYGILSMPHPARLSFMHRGVDNVDTFLPSFLSYLKNNGLNAMEIFYGNYSNSLRTAFFDILLGNEQHSSEEQWFKIFFNFCDANKMLKTGGYDTHNKIIYPDKFQEVLDIWQDSQALIAKGYQVLDKEVTMGLPGPCMPAISDEQDTGIGSPYGQGAKRVQKFFSQSISNIQLGPSGRTCLETKHSPYVSDVLHNPFFIPLEELVADGLLKKETLDKIYNMPKKKNEIDFSQVEAAYTMVFKELYGDNPSELAIEKLALHYIKLVTYPYIGDIQVQIPESVYEENKDVFLEGFTLGVPGDVLNPQPRNWGFRVLNPAKFFNADGSLGKAGKILYDIFYESFASNKGGMRIDHFIGMVNPFVVSKDESIPSGRLYSSYDNPVLQKFAKHNLKEFSNITTDIILKAAKANKVDASNLYLEDIGSRPEQLDEVIKYCGLGRLLVSQFVEIDDDNHIYRIKNAKTNDIATLDTHDTMSIHNFYKNMNDENRYKHALKLSQDLRFSYSDDLKSDRQLIRMKWGELLASPARRVHAFFTSFTGQDGRYNQPGNPIKWVLRCDNNFDKLYFSNIVKGTAYNPFDAICLAIYARGDDFFSQYQDLVAKLRAAEEKLLKLASQL